MSEWTGYGAVVELAQQLRADLAQRFGTTPRFGWYFRTDPQIAEVYGHTTTSSPNTRIASLP